MSDTKSKGIAIAAGKIAVLKKIVFVEGSPVQTAKTPLQVNAAAFLFFGVLLVF